MQRASHQVYWNEHMGRYQIKVIRGRITHWPGIVPDSTEWFSWLQRLPSFAFQAQAGGHFTPRKERRRRGGAYWIAYRHIAGQLGNKYIAPQAQVTTTRLEEIPSQPAKQGSP